MTVFGMFVCNILSVSVCRCTVSNALDISSAMASVRCGGLCWLKPVLIVLFIVCSAVIVECFVLNPC